MTRDQAEDALAELTARGFDMSRITGPETAVRVSCSRCDALVIQGVACHESGCPNETRECSECDARVPKGQRLCEDCARAEEDADWWRDTDND